ncbi:MAG: sulfatase-like hydrolase/transferase, partial [Tepidiformaceae bacterium]
MAKTKEAAREVVGVALENLYERYARQHIVRGSRTFAALAADRFIIGNPDDCVAEIRRIPTLHALFRIRPRREHASRSNTVVLRGEGGGAMVMEMDDFRGSIGRTYRDSQPWWPEPVAIPPGAPDILLVVLDDVGFSDLGCYGSEIATPRMDQLAGQGLRWSNFHVTSMCSPTRACLLAGRNAHSVGVGIIAEWSSGFPAYQGRISKRAATLAEILRDHGYGTYAVGKWHLTGLADYGAAGPHDDWPLGRGFSQWFGFHGALMDHWHPELYRDNHPL